MEPGTKQVEITLNELEVGTIDAAAFAKHLRITQAKAEYDRIELEAKTRFNEAAMIVLKHHGLTKVPQIFHLELRDEKGKLIAPGTFRYIPEPETTPDK